MAISKIPSAGTTGFGRRNLIINGAMSVAQRGTSKTGVITSGYYTVDRWKMNGNNGTWTVGQDTSTPNGFANSYKMTLTATEAIGSSSYMSLEQKMEGINLQSLAYGSSAAKDIILSFWVKSNITGNYCVNTYQDDGSSNYPETYTINTADTWEYKTIKYDGNTATSLDNDVNSSLRVIFFLVAASELSSGSTGSRVAYSADTYAAGQSAQIDAVNDYWQVTGVQLEVGSTATEFEHRSFAEELALCQRYFEYISPCGVHAHPVWAYTTGGASTRLYFAVEKRTRAYSAGTEGTFGGSATNHRIYYNGAYRTFTGFGIAGATSKAFNSARLDFTGITGVPGGSAAGYYNVGSDVLTSHVYVDDEL